MSVYFVRATVPDGPIKIGFAGDFASREKSLRAMSPVPLETLLVINGDRSLELALHQRFASHRRNGEWFNPHPDILSYIASPYPVQSEETSFSSLIRGWGIAEFAEAIGVPYSHASVMAVRNSVSIDHWPALLAALEARGVTLTMEELHALRQRRREVA
jgi:hypothetical protein